MMLNKSGANAALVGGSMHNMGFPTPGFRLIACFASIAFLLFYPLQEGNCAEGEAASLQVMLEHFNSTDARTRERGVWEVGMQGMRAGLFEKRLQALEGLGKLLKDPDKNVRLAAAETLASLDPGNGEPIAILIDALNGEEPPTGPALIIKYQYGASARDAVPALISAMKRRPKSEAIWASTLERIGTPEALEAIKPYQRRQDIKRRLASPMDFLLGNIIGSSSMMLAFLGLYFWSRSRRKKGERILCWPLWVPMVVGAFCVYCAIDAALHPPDFGGFPEIPIALSLLVMAGLLPWAVSLALASKTRNAVAGAEPK
jgi:hypothetical protein